MAEAAANANASSPYCPIAPYTSRFAHITHPSLLSPAVDVPGCTAGGFAAYKKTPLQMHDPTAEILPPRAPFLVGRSWALGLGVALLAAVAFVTVARRVERPAAALEEIVQVPIPAAAPTPTPAVLAPDPGDNP